MKKYLFLPAAALTVFAACNQKEEDFNKEQVTDPVIETVKMQFRAATEDSPSKTTLTPETGAVSWTAGDAVKFVYELDGTPGSAISSTLNAEDIDGEGVATFTASVPAAFAMTEKEYINAGGSSLHLYAVSPASIEIDYETASSFYLTVPTVQDGTFENASIAVAKWDKENPAGTLEFKNLCGLLKFTIADDNVRKVILHSDDYIAGKMDVGFTGGPAVKNVSKGEKAITVNVPGAGTYYIAVLPTDESRGIGINNIYVELLDESDNLIGDKGSANPLVIARKQIRNIGTLATGFSDRMYFTTDGKGSKDGSNWDNAGDVALLKTTMASAITKSLYLAAGDYNLGSASVACTAASNIKIYGGFPDNLSGYAISGRDLSANTTTLKANDTVRPFYINNASAVWLFDGISFLCTNYSGANGGAFSLLNGKATANYCVFDGCSNTATNYNGVIRVDANGTGTFTHCTFTNNTAESNGGVFYVAGAVSVSDSEFSNNTSGANGGAIYVTGAATLKINNCLFDTNATKTNGGAIHFQANTGNNCTISNSKFIHNSTTTDSPGDNAGLGSAISTAGTGGGTITVENCLFQSNSAAQKGAVWARSNNYHLTGCHFIDNTTRGRDYHGSAIFIDRAYSVYCDGCYFGYTTESCNDEGAFTGTGITIAVGSSTYASTLGLNNCVLAGPWGTNAQQQIIIQNTSSKATIVNSTLFGQISSGNIRNYGTCSIINSIVVNAASSGKGYFINNNTDSYTNIDYSYYSSLNGTTTSSINNSLAGIYVHLDAGANTNFANGWYKVNAKTMYGNNNTETKEVNDYRESIHFYAWNNLPTAEGIESYSNPSLSSVQTIVNTRDAAFGNWLSTNGSLAVDIRGVARNTSAMWPGSYEQASGVASAPAFTLK